MEPRFELSSTDSQNLLFSFTTVPDFRKERMGKAAQLRFAGWNTVGFSGFIIPVRPKHLDFLATTSDVSSTPWPRPPSNLYSLSVSFGYYVSHRLITSSVTFLPVQSVILKIEKHSREEWMKVSAVHSSEARQRTVPLYCKE